MLEQIQQTNLKIDLDRARIYLGCEEQQIVECWLDGSDDYETMQLLKVSMDDYQKSCIRIYLLLREVLKSYSDF